MTKIKHYLSIILALILLICSILMFTVGAAGMTETEDIVVHQQENLWSDDELQPMMATSCGDYDDDEYYIQGEPEIPVGAMLIGEPTVGSYVSESFLIFIVGQGYSSDGWYYYMENYRMPNGQIIKYHIWSNDDESYPTYYHKR